MIDDYSKIEQALDASVQAFLEKYAPKAICDVIMERHRQIAEEGWTPEHDDQHEVGMLAAAGSAYALYVADELHPQSQGNGGFADTPPLFWPFDPIWWKPGEHRRSLVKAAALILAEIERYDRNYP